MPEVPFDQLPDDARLWVFPLASTLEPADEKRLRAEIDRFLAQWKAHGIPLRAGRDWVEGRFLLVAVDPNTEPPSGCSIDALLRLLKHFEDETGVTLTDHGAVFYRDRDGAVRSVSRRALRELARAGEFGPDVPVFDTTLTSVGALRAGRLEVPAREAWHGRAFFRDAPAGAEAGT